VRSGRAAKFQTAGGYIRADGLGSIYWIDGDGTRVLRGVLPDTAEELQSGFIEKMLMAGSGA